MDFTNPAAYAWWRIHIVHCGRSALTPSRATLASRFPADALAHNGDSGARVHNVNSHLYNRCVPMRASREAFGNEACVGPCRLDWLATPPAAMGRRPAERLGRVGGQPARRHESRALRLAVSRD